MKEKIYINRYEKIMDFIIGSTLVPLIMWISWIAMSRYHMGRYFNAIGIILLIEAGLSTYLALKRKYFGGGLLTAIAVIFLILLGTCVLNPNILVAPLLR